MKPERRGFALYLVLMAAVVLGLLGEALVLRQATGSKAIHHALQASQDRYESLGLLGELLARLRQGDTPEQAAAAARKPGRTVLYAGNRFLVDAPDGGALVARLSSRAYRHVLFGASLDLRGQQAGFQPEDPHSPALGAPPGPQTAFLEIWRKKALQGGVLLVPEPKECRFQPGGGEWIPETRDGKPSFLYLGGGTGEGLGWTPGLHRWTLEGGTWACTTGEKLLLNAGIWELKKGGLLAGTLLVEGCALKVSEDTRLEGSLVVWGGGLELSRGTLTVQPGQATTLAVATMRGQAAAADPLPWNRDRVLRPGDLVLATGSAGLEVADLERAEATGALVLAQHRLVRVGGGLHLAGVAAASLVEVHGVPAQDLVWSGRVGRLPPEGLGGGDPCLEAERSLLLP